jgi:hypothetical protein
MIKKKKLIWMVAGGDMQLLSAALLYKKYDLLITDKNPKAICKKYSKYFYPIDIYDEKNSFKLLNKFKKRLSGIFTIASDCHLIVSKLAKKAGLHHTPIEISQLCYDKINTRKFLKKYFIQPKSFFIKDYDDLKKKTKLLKSDYVLKHLNLSGSKGFHEFRYDDILTNSQFEKNIKKYPLSKGILIEEKLKKNQKLLFSEMSAESIWQNGKIIFFNCVDRIFPRDIKNLSSKKYQNLKNFLTDNNGFEIGHINPSTLNSRAIKDIKKLIFIVGSKLGYGRLKGCHVLKLDIFFSEKGPVILEMTPRLSGGYDSTGSSFERGFNLTKAITKVALNSKFNRKEINLYLKPKNKFSFLVLSKYSGNKRNFFMSKINKSFNFSVNDILNKIEKSRNILYEQKKNFATKS